MQCAPSGEQSNQQGDRLPPFCSNPRSVVAVVVTVVVTVWLVAVIVSCCWILMCAILSRPGRRRRASAVASVALRSAARPTVA